MENTQLLKDNLTIVIPSKNEKRTLYDCIYNISKQKNIEGTKIIIADISNDKESLDFIRRIESDFRYSLSIEVIKGGYPAYGRFVGGQIVKTPYVLFLDADILIHQKDLLINVLKETKHLSTVTISTEKSYNWVYKIFNTTQKIMKFFGSSFAVGGFQLFRTDIYRFAGEYNPNHLFAEDYYISNKIYPGFFTIYNTDGVYTSSRRFRNKGIFYMIFLMIKCWLNRNNENFYLKSYDYWS